jgi:guanosine-3',5'-bis(diphosphate) 3'-pyrophosphohydrolase
MSARLQKVQAYAERSLKHIRRGSGETYATHGKDVSKVLSEVTNDESILCIAILHDILVHPDGAALLKASPLTKDERSIVERMYTLRRLHIDENTDDLDLVIGSFVEDPRLMLLRMAHRLNDIRHLSRFPKKRRKELAHETLHMYSAISGRLGFQRWRWQMEDICFLELQPKIAKHIQKEFEQCRRIDLTCLKHTTAFLQDKMKEQNISVTVDQRIKGLYSTYRKMILKKKSFDELTDRIALRIIVPKQDDCYRALGVVHGSMHAIPGKLKDYIGTPKENGYRSLHTVVFPLAGVSVLPIEIQIRSKAMHEECEYGIASHTDYKDMVYALTNPQSRTNLFRNLENLRSLGNTPKQFEEALRTSFRDDEIILFDPENTHYRMRPPATALDFACISLHLLPSNVTGARINGRKQALSLLLRDGDTVEILTGKTTLTPEDYLKASQQPQTRKIVKAMMKK